MNEQAAVVSLKSVTKDFARGGVRALQEIDLEVRPREFVSFIGPSGCGKSTLLRIIGDLVPPTAGEVVVNGKQAHQARLDRDYGIVFQDAVLYDWRTVAKNIALPLEMAGVSGKFSIKATVHGGGPTGQAGALRHAIARALVSLSQPLRAPLKKEGLLTRDSRVKERKKYGQKGARKRFQYSKR